ncbi:hypothetical protein [Paenibacillus sacheonensis]|uniref:DUF5658 domain-containing protein n=1 Tax=Paenibacillus sacheonensis TaxID=742054 RepID=A0A7X4YQJ9_9BACL|nr:hypothetical protein [Paenibacillus sacheonensis]MBM7567825.1 hypothetical protein [Paenibacillus sacheonensis]NBC70715.1 hypothetical protein [Paenibacillus sacheonensis]
MLYDTDILLFYAYKLILPLILLTLVRRVNRPSFIAKGVLPVTMLYGIVAVYRIAWLVIVLTGWQ